MSPRNQSPGTRERVQAHPRLHREMRKRDADCVAPRTADNGCADRNAGARLRATIKKARRSGPVEASRAGGDANRRGGLSAINQEW